MANSTSFLFLANTVLAVHVLFVCFVVFGLLLIYLGFFLRWAWVRNPVFRLLHVAAIGLVVMQSWAGMICPLTTWEMALRARAGVDTYTGAFIQHWLHSVLYYTAPEWVFIAAYTAFGSLVIVSWLIVRPHPLRDKSG